MRGVWANKEGDLGKEWGDLGKECILWLKSEFSWAKKLHHLGHATRQAFRNAQRLSQLLAFLVVDKNLSVTLRDVPFHWTGQQLIVVARKIKADTVLERLAHLLWVQELRRVIQSGVATGADAMEHTT